MPLQYTDAASIADLGTMDQTDNTHRALPAWTLHTGLLLLSLAFVLVSLHLLTPVYMENTRSLILDYATQGFSMPYTGIFFTSLLHTAYVHWPDIPWYACALYGLHMLAVYLWLTLVFRVFHPVWLAALLAVLLLGYYLVFLVHLDYTSTSVMLCTAALRCYPDVMERRTGYLHYLLPGAVFMLGGMLVRPQGAPGALAYTLPVGLLAARVSLWDMNPNRSCAPVLLVGVLFMAPALVEDRLDHAWRAYISTPHQNHYDAFNDARGKLHSINRARKQTIIRDAKLLKSVGWTRRDAADFFNWKFLDERIYTPEALRTLLAAAPPPQLSPKSVLGTVAGRLPPADMLFLMIVAPAPLLLLLAGRRRDLAIAGMLIVLYAVALSSFMTLFFTFKWRVLLPFETGFAYCRPSKRRLAVTRHGKGARCR